MLGYDWPRLHAALNDLPAALLLVSVLFDLVGAGTRRDTLKAAGFWTLIVGVLGLGAAILTGKLTEGVIDHTDRAHAVMETHETLAYIVLALFGLLALWRLARRGAWSPREQPVALTAGVIGVALLVYTAKLGGNLVFDHALGLPTARIQAITEERGGHEHAPAPGDSLRAPGDTARAAGDSAKTHTHTDGSSHTHND